MASRAAIGLRAHSGWAAAVALADSPAVISRRRIEMLDGGPAQPYHAAVGLDIRDAQRVVDECASRAASRATAGLQTLIKDLQALGHEIVGCGLLLASGRPLPGLAAILASHALIHTAEGELFREALRAAVRNCGLPLIEIKERDIIEEKQITLLGKSIGPPWRQDQKLASAVAWLALAQC